MSTKTSHILAEVHRELPDSVPEADWNQVSQKFREAILDAIEANRWPICMYGSQGRGKSCAAACVYARWPQKALWYDATTAIRQIMTCRSNGAGFITVTANGRDYELTENQIFRRVADFPFVAFDDLGLRESTEAQFAAFYQMVNSRTARPTVFTGNINPQSLTEVYDGRIASRLLAGTILHVVGQDRRIKNAIVVEV